jgi:dTDP-4-dehydrorhamnose reductase
MAILVTGASGQLGGYLLREVRNQGLAAVAWSGSCAGERFGFPLHPVDLASPTAVAAAFAEARPTAVLHAGALASVSECFRQPERARRVNTEGAALLSRLAEATGARFVYISTDLVFDGERGGYREDDVPRPLSFYGRTKADAEQEMVRCPRATVVRLSLLFGPSVTHRLSFFDEQVAALRAGRPLPLFEDEWRTPLSLATAARALIAIARSDATDILHLGGPERMSRLEMGRRLAAFLGCDPSTIVPARRNAGAPSEPRPRDTSLDSSRWRRLFPEHPWPSWEEALRALIA